MAELRIGNILIQNGVLLAPMEDITDMPYRIIAKRMGADLVYSEFISSEAIIRNIYNSSRKMLFDEEERPLAIQIFGSNVKSMVESAKIIEDTGVDFIDLNFGCWVKNVVQNNAGAALLKEPDKMVELTKAVVDAVKLPVTIKTRLGWDRNSIIIDELAQRLEDTGIHAMTVHCRTRHEAHRGEADWSWIPKIKAKVKMPIILNGDVKSHLDVKRAFDETGCNAVMIGQAAIGNPFIFKESKEYLATGKLPDKISYEERIAVCLSHLKLSIEYKGTAVAIKEFRKHYSGYLKGLHNSHTVRQKLVTVDSFDEVVTILQQYKNYLNEYEQDNLQQS